MNNKGFMMAEVVVVASIILVALVGLYASYNKIFSIYNQRVDYYDVPTLYELADFKNISLPSNTSTSPALNNSGKIIYYVNRDVIKNNTLNVSNQTFKDYLEYLSTSLDFEKFESDGVTNLLVMEKCIDTDNCKYAYLEVYD